MEVTVLSYKLFTFKADLAAILNRECCHININYKFILTTVCRIYLRMVFLMRGGGGFEQKAEQ